MEDFTNFSVAGIPEITCTDPSYDEKLEAECILRIRTIFDEFVCPKTGVYMMCTFSELMNGIQRLWSLTQELKGLVPDIREWIINLPLMFISVLLRNIEREYTQEDHEKTSNDPQLGESLLDLFYDFQKKSNFFRKKQSQATVFNTAVLYSRYLVSVLGMDEQIQRIKWNELRVLRIVIISPLRKSDAKVILEAFRHFRDHILPQFSKRSVRYKLFLQNRIPEVMEPTLRTQLNVSHFLFKWSAISIAFSFLLLIVLHILDCSTSTA